MPYHYPYPYPYNPTPNPDPNQVIDEDEAEEYEDAVALNNAMSHLQLNQPLDASQLDDDGKCRVLLYSRKQ